MAAFTALDQIKKIHKLCLDQKEIEVLKNLSKSPIYSRIYEVLKPPKFDTVFPPQLPLL